MSSSNTTPLIVTQIAQLRALRQSWRVKQANTAFVPTMGNLHAGHLELVAQAKQLAEHVIVSIFVNPLQFGPNEDFASYPRTRVADIEKLTALGIDAVFIPDVAELYPNDKPLTKVMVHDLGDILCGQSRPGHFTGVTTVVAKLFNIVQPEIAIFGEKDFQQLTIIRQMVADLNFPIEIIGHPTARAADGLALSSRNQYLSAEQRANAPQLYATLRWLQQEIQSGNRAFTQLCTQARERLAQSQFKVDYLEVRTKQLAIPTPQDQELIILAAAFLGKTRLIDNISVRA